MLTLDPTTLFYFSLRDNNVDHEGIVADWAAKVSCNAKPGSSHSKATLLLTHGSTGTCSGSHASPSTWSTFNTIKMSHHNGGIKIAEGGLSDADGTKGCERDTTIKGPLKGKQRIKSSVSYYLSFILMFCHSNLCFTPCDRP